MEKIIIVSVILIISIAILLKPGSMPEYIGKGVDCSLLPAELDNITFGADPIQINITADKLDFEKITLYPVAAFAVESGVLSSKTYKNDAISGISRVDLAMGWGRLMNPEVLREAKIKQVMRFGNFRLKSNIISVTEFISLFANIHTIPSNKDIAKKLTSIDDKDIIRMKGWLVNVKMKEHNYIYHTSTIRTDDGPGACEIIYVCDVETVGKMSK